MNMTLEDFYQLYKRDVSNKVRPNTWEQKTVVIETKIIPYLGKRKIDELKVADIFEWQNEMRKLKTKEGKLLSDSYLNTIHGQLSAMQNHAVKFYGLKWNVANKAGNMASKRNRKVEMCIRDREYIVFSSSNAEKLVSQYDKELEEIENYIKYKNSHVYYFAYRMFYDIPEQYRADVVRAQMCIRDRL